MRALSPSTPTYIFPAMNTLMYEHPLTAEHLRVVKDVIKYNVVGPIGKALACGDIGEFSATQYLIFHSNGQACLGVGAMSEWKDIVQIVVDRFQLRVAPGNETGQA